MACKHDRFLQIIAEHNKANFFTIPHMGIEQRGEVPSINGLADSEHIHLDVCLDCGVVIGFKPMKDKEVKTVLRMDEDVEFDDDAPDDVEELDGEVRW